ACSYASAAFPVTCHCPWSVIALSLIAAKFALAVRHARFPVKLSLRGRQRTRRFGAREYSKDARSRAQRSPARALNTNATCGGARVRYWGGAAASAWRLHGSSLG